MSDIDDASALLANLEEFDEVEPSTEVNVRDLASELVSLEGTAETDVTTSFDVKEFDGAAVVHFRRTFEDYAIDVFIPCIVQQLDSLKRVYIVWDRYVKGSIKKRKEEKESEEMLQDKIRFQNGGHFLCDADNKQEFFTSLAEKIKSSELPSGKELVTTYGNGIPVRDSDLSMPAFKHEEVDTTQVSHVHHALQQGKVSCLVRTVYTDVVILREKVHQLQDLCPKANIWVGISTERNFSYIHNIVIAQSLVKENSTALPVFHSFTVCHTVYSFLGKRKKSEWMA
ncbi:hypothetical protein NDU88_006898 [Pleurodeles waltl]|uniref:Uncharacterized protein n=1 Tax=Pleurodeles waltl TaxID=8319 RepID=A0AAV7MFC9_PLEWA|nr:hypothetical protein NDU88_006898 [Pleurodeles waltl]